MKERKMKEIFVDGAKTISKMTLGIMALSING
jgi:hypothetical protein